MLLLLIDAGYKFEPKGNYNSFEPRDISSTQSKNKELRIYLNTVSIVDGSRDVIIYNVDDLKVKQVTTLVNMLYDKHPDVRVIMTCRYEEDVSKHILQLLGLRKKKLRTPGTKREPSFFEKLTNYIRTRQPVEKGLMLPFLKSMGFNERLAEPNRELVAELDQMLFETHEEYLSYAWSGLHVPQKIRPSFKEVFKPEKVKKPKKTPVARKTRRAKKKEKIKKSKAQKLADYF